MNDEYILSEFVHLEAKALYASIYQQFTQLTLHKLLVSYNAYFLATQAFTPIEVVPYLLNRHIDEIKDTGFEQIIESVSEYTELSDPYLTAAEFLAYWKAQYEDHTYNSVKSKLLNKLSKQFTKNFITVNNEVDWKLVVEYVNGNYKLKE